MRFAVLACVFAFSTAALLLASYLEKRTPGWRPLNSAFYGALTGTALVLFYGALVRRFRLRSFSIRSRRRSVGAALALVQVMFLVSALAQRPDLGAARGPGAREVAENLLYQVSSGYAEEAGFRYGLANVAFGFFGFWPGVVAGAVPFGLIHLIHFVSGGAIQWDYILGVSLGGLFLTLVFFDYGLVAAVAAHYVWNALAYFLSRSLAIDQERLEGGPVTLAMLGLASLWLLWRWKRGDSAAKSPTGQ